MDVASQRSARGYAMSSAFSVSAGRGKVPGVQNAASALTSQPVLYAPARFCPQALLTAVNHNNVVFQQH